MAETIEEYCKRLIEELEKEADVSNDIGPLLNALKELNLAYEATTEPDRDLIYYWIQEEGKRLADMSIEQIIEEQKKHLKRQKALEAFISYETIKAKTKESTTFLLIDKMMKDVPSSRREQIKKLLKKKVKPQGKAPRKAPKRLKKGIERLRALGLSEEQIAVYTKKI